MSSADDPLVVELRRIADALERLATEPRAELPPRRQRQRPVSRPRPAAPRPVRVEGVEDEEVDELTDELARRGLERAGLA